IAREVSAALPVDARRVYLLEVARRADGGALPALAYWAYGALLELEPPEEQLLALRTRVAELALVVGDTARAVAQYEALEGELAARSPERRQSLVVRIELAARSGDADGAAAQLAAFRTEYPEAPETDRLLGMVGGALLDAGRVDEAEQLVAAARGPHAGMTRGRVLLIRGDVQRGRNELLNAAPALSGAQATEAIALATLLGRLSPA